MGNEKITDPKVQVEEGDRYYNGDGVGKDFAMAAAWYEKAANQGYAEGQYYLGYCYYAGEGVELDFEKAVEWYIKAAEQGHPKAQQKLGTCYYNGEGVEQDLDKMIYWYKKSAEQGRSYSQYLLGACYYDGTGIEKDFEKAIHWFKKAADQNDDTAQCMLGLCYYYGSGVDVDNKQAVLWLEKSAEQGNSDAQFYLGDCYYNGEGVEEDQVKAARLFEEAAEQEHPTAQFRIAYLYLKGEGVKCDAQKAIDWYTKSAEQGFDRAQYSLGICYKYGEGTLKDLKKAAEWLTKAAEQGHADSCTDLAQMYFEGEGVEHDFEKGAYWFREAAKSGDPRSMLSFGAWLLGETVRQQGINDAYQWLTDKAEAFRWLIRAAGTDIVPQSGEDFYEHDENEVMWEARWILAEIFEYGLYEITKDLNAAKLWYEKLVDIGDDSAAVYVKLMEQKKEDPYSSPGWEMKHLIARTLVRDYPEFDAVSALYEEMADYQDAVFTSAERDECLPTAEKIIMLADLSKSSSLLAFAEEAKKEDDAYFKTALKMAANGMRADLTDEVLKVLFVKDKPEGAALLKRLIIHRGICHIIKGDYTAQKLKMMLGSLYVPRLLSPNSKEKKYKMTFNYLLTHREIPRLFFEDLNSFYQKVLPDPEMMQRFLFFAYNRSKYFATENPDIEPAFEIENFEMYMYEETKGRSVIIITFPKCDNPPESYQIAIPTARQRAGYYACEFSVDPLTNEPCFIFGEWKADNQHNNYGKIEMKNENSFAQMAVEIAYGKAL